MRSEVIIMIDDITGKELPVGAGDTVRFALDGDTYEIDLDAKTADKLRQLLQKYASSGRRTSPSAAPRRRQAPVRTAASSTTVRAWAAAHGIKISDRGRVPAAVTAQFEAAGN